MHEEQRQAYMGDLEEKNLGVYDLPLGFLRLNENNERQTWRLDNLIDLVDSLKKTGGNITPGIVEWVDPPLHGRKERLERIVGSPARSPDADACSHGSGIGSDSNEVGSLGERLCTGKDKDGIDPDMGLDCLVADHDSPSGNPSEAFNILGGNRRYMGLRLLGLPKMKVRVLAGLTDEERIEIQFVENATKTKIPSWQIAESIWELMQYRIAIINGFDSEEEIRAFRFPDLWSVPYELRKGISIRGFAELIHKPESMVRSALNYARLHKTIKRLVEDGKVSYSAAAEFGRIQNRNTQIAEFARAGSRNLSSRSARKHVAGYLESLKQDDPGVLELASEAHQPDLYKGFSSRIGSLSRMLAKLERIIESDGNILGMTGQFFCDSSLADVIISLKERQEELSMRYAGNPAYARAWDAYLRKKQGRKPLLDMILDGEKRIVSKEKAIDGLRLDAAAYMPFIDLRKISPCRNQPRQSFNKGTFDRRKFNEMVRTIKKYGILQPVLVRPKGEDYEVVVGETRYRAAKEAGLAGIDALVLDMDDVTARIVQMEEDFYEQVLPMERAARLNELWEKKRQVIGEGYSKAMFCREYDLGQRTLREAITYMSLDDRTKRLYETGLIRWSAAIELAAVEDEEQRLEYAMMASVLDLSAKDLKRKRYTDKTQMLIPFPDYDHHKESIRALQKAAIDMLAEMSGVLWERRAAGIDKETHEQEHIVLAENMTRREHFNYLFEIADSLERIYDEISRC